MQMGELCRRTGLTRKAVEYYIKQGLVTPRLRENGYREFDGAAEQKLRRIALLRRLGLSLPEIRAVLAEKTNGALQRIAAERALHLRKEETVQAALEALSRGDRQKSEELLAGAELRQTIAQKLLNAFPGYYGQFLCLHFAGFLNGPLQTDAQRAAYGRVVAFLDRAEPPALSEELLHFLEESTASIGPAEMAAVDVQLQRAAENPEAYFRENEAALRQYLEFRQSEEYRVSPAAQLQAALKNFCSASGYYEEFLPAMRIMSPAYEAYQQALAQANEALLRRFPEAAALEER